MAAACQLLPTPPHHSCNRGSAALGPCPTRVTCTGGSAAAQPCTPHTPKTIVCRGCCLQSCTHCHRVGAALPCCLEATQHLGLGVLRAAGPCTCLHSMRLVPVPPCLQTMEAKVASALTRKEFVDTFKLLDEKCTEELRKRTDDPTAIPLYIYDNVNSQGGPK